MKLRQFLRVLVQCPVECVGDDFFVDGMAINVSMGGLTITSDQQPRPGTSISLRLYLPDGEAPIIVKQAIVQWSQEGQFGVKAMSMQEPDRSRLNDFIVSHVNKTASPRRLSSPQSDS